MKNFRQVISKIFHWYSRISPRERMLILGASLVFVVILVSEVTERLITAYDAQESRKEGIVSTLNETVMELGKYSRLSKRKKEVESAYEGVSIEEGALSYIESLIKNQAGISSGFLINPRPPKKFAEHYEQSSFDIKFTTSDFSRLIRFLTEVTTGAKPLILSSLDVRKRANGDSVDVTLEVSSIKRVSGQNT